MMESLKNSITVQLHSAQLGFVSCRDAPYVGFVGGRGAGKSVSASMRLWKYSMTEPGLYGMYAPTFPLLRDTIQRVFIEQAALHISDRKLSDGVIKMQSGSEIICRSLDDPEHARGPSLRGAVVDEASLCSIDAFNILIACLRYEGSQGWLACAFTPKGPNHWTADIFNNPARQNVKCFHARTSENPFNPPGFRDLLATQYTKIFARQELDGAFVNVSGGVYKSEWLKIVDQLPPAITMCRAWDFAATEKQAGGDPDYTAGALIGRASDNRTYIADIKRGRYGPADVEQLPLKIAQQDGKAVQIILEQEGGASGKILVNSLIRSLVGYIARAGEPRGDKMTRSMPLFAQAEAGNVYLLRGAWNRDFLAEVDSFGSGFHDDQIDACAHAFNYLTTPSSSIVFV